MAQKDGSQAQKIVSQAIEEYTDRHNHPIGQSGAKDLQTLSACDPQKLFQGKLYLIIQCLELHCRQGCLQPKCRKMGRNTA